MQVGAEIREKVKEMVLVTMPVETFKQFAPRFTETGGVDFQNDVDGAYSLRLGEYLVKLDYNGMVPAFVEFYAANLLPAAQKFAQVLAAQAAISELYEARDGKWQVAEKYFKNCLVRDNFAFLDRHEVRNHVKKLVVERDSQVLLLSGKPQSGLSYVSLFLNEFDEKFRSYKLVDINFKEDVAGYAENLIYAAHLAQIIADRIGMANVNIDLANPSLFKTSPFLSKLTEFLGKQPTIPLFFLHQFDVPLSEDLHAMIKGLATMSLKNTNIRLIVAGYDKTSEWQFVILHNCRELDIQDGQFSEIHVQEFFECVYARLAASPLAVKIEREKFLETVKEVVTKEQMKAVPNVAIVGQQLSKWFKGFNEAISQA